MAENPIEFRIEDKSPAYVVLGFRLTRPIKPEELAVIEPPPLPHATVLIISGRGPIWLHAHLLHHYLHIYPVIAIYDPKQAGAVVVASHTPEVEEGRVIQMEGI